MNTDPIVVVCATDSRYVLPLAVMLRSIAEHMRDDQPIECYVLYSGVSPGDRERVRESLPEKQIHVTWIPADASRVKGLPVWGRMPVTTYFKLLVPDLIPPEIERALWLDCDMLVARDISSLWKIDLDGRSTGAAQDQLVPLVSSRGGIGVWPRLGLARDAKYFNAGVMLMDLTAWRRERIAQRALDYLRENSRSVMFWDQEGLNAAIAGDWKELSRSWNVNVSLPGWRNAPRDRAPAIFHFAGMLKPWAYRTADPEWSLYNQYLDHTAWAGLRPERSALNAMISLYERSGIRRVTHSLENVMVGMLRTMSIRSVRSGSGVSIASQVPLES